MNGGGPPEVREALAELDQYLADALPPLLVADSVKLIISCPPQLLARHLVAWSLDKGVPAESADRLAKALGRLHRVADLQLLERSEYNRFMTGFEPTLLASCPVDARIKLRTLMRQVERSRGDDGTQQTAEQKLPGWFGPSEGAGQAGDSMVRHILPLLDRLAETLAQAKSGAYSGGASQETVSQLLAVVTKTAQTAQQLEERLERLKGLGLDTEVSTILKVLGQSVPNWAVVTPSRSAQQMSTAGDPDLKYSDTRLQAMQRIVELAKAPEENTARFGQMVDTAVEQFNQGALGRAVSILESAHQLVIQKKVDASKSRPIWEKAQEKIQWHRFGPYLADPVQHHMLQKFISFFPAFAPSSLLARLKRDRPTHRVLLALLQVQKSVSRSEALRRLEVMLGSVPTDEPEDWDYIRDLLVLLTSDEPGELSQHDDASEVLTRLAEIPLPLPVFRELVRYATQSEQPESVDLLTTLLRQPALQPLRWDREDEATGFHWSTGLEQILSRLAGVHSPRARRLVLDHCLDRAGMPGILTSPLAVLGSTDLSEDGEAVSRLLAALKYVLRRRWLGFLRRRNERAALDLVRALAGTSSEQIRSFLADVARRFPNSSFGIAASQASGQVQSRVTVLSQDDENVRDMAPLEAGLPTGIAAESTDEVLLEGQLDSFDLPTLIQHLTNCRLTGLLELLDPAGRVHGIVILAGGQIRRCRVGRLAGKEAFYLLLEKPVLGRFRMIRPAAGSAATELEAAHSDPPLPMMAMLLEGMRRYDEYRQSCLLVPDEMVLIPTGQKHSRPEDEDDVELISSVWEILRSGKTAGRCEEEIEADPFRVRRLLAHWVSEGALQESKA